MSGLLMRYIWQLMRVVALSCMVCVVGSAGAQTAAQYIRAADKAYDKADYFSSGAYYQAAIEAGADKLTYGYKLAESLRQFHDYKKSLAWYEQTLGLDKQNKYPHTLYHIAYILKSQMRYAEADSVYKRYLAAGDSSEAKYWKRVPNDIAGCALAHTLVADSLRLETDHPGSEINSPYSDFSPTVTADGELYFSSLRFFSKPSGADKEKYFISKILSSKPKGTDWNRNKALPSRINDLTTHTSNGFLTADGSTLYFTYCNTGDPSDVKCRIFVAEVRGSQWQKPKELPTSINAEKATTTQPSLSILADSTRVLFFSSDRAGGRGGMDIWYVTMDSKGKMSNPLNAGSAVNTKGDEVTPFFDASDSTLYFSSDWHVGMGGFDIFKSRGLPGNWNIIENVGYPLNSSHNDLYYRPGAPGSMDVFLASNRVGALSFKGEACCYDIFRLHPPIVIDTVPVVAIVKPPDTAKDSAVVVVAPVPVADLIAFLPMRLYFENDEPDCCNTRDETKKSYQQTYKDYIGKWDTYRTEFSKNVAGNDKEQAAAATDEFFTGNVVKGMTQLEKFTPLLLANLRDGRSYTLVFKGYTSPLAKTEYNTHLARRRISSVMNFFKQYENGALLPFIQGSEDKGAVLRIREEPLGESQTRPGVSDVLSDKRNSVYNPAAGHERRIEIIKIDEKK